MENNQENIPPIIQPQPPKRLDKKLVVLIIIALVGLAFVYIFYPKNITSCGILPDGPSCAKYVCWGIPMQGFGAPVCWGKLKLVGPTASPQPIESQDLIYGQTAEDLCGPQPPILCQANMRLGCRVADKKWGCYPSSSETDVSTWQTYRNEVYGFEFKYPSTLRIKADGGGYFRLGKTKEVNETFLEIIYGEAGSNFDNTQAKYVDTILLGSIPARKYSAPEGLCDGPDLCSPAAVQINVNHETKEYALIFYGSADLTEEQQQILSTFKFIKLGQVNIKVSNLEPDSFNWCIANGGVDRTPNYNAPKVCVLTNKVYEENCVSNTKYFVIESSLTDSVGANHLVKFKTSENQNFDCKYIVEKGDFEIKNEWAEYILALENNLLILDSGTGPDPRGLIVYDLNLRKKVYEDSYSRPINIQTNIVDYWTGTTKPVTEQNCPEFKKWEEGGLGSAIDAHVSLNLSTLVKKELGEYRCSPRQ